MFTDQSVTTIAFHKGRFKATSCETWEKRIFIFFFYFFFIMNESVILTRNGTDKTLDLSLDLE